MRPENLENYRLLSSEYLIDLMRDVFRASPKIRELLITAMKVPIRAPEIIDLLLQAIEARDVDAALQALKRQTGGRTQTISTAAGLSPAKIKTPYSTVANIIDLYMSVEDKAVALNLLRYMIFFNNPKGLVSFITSVKERIKGATPEEINTEIRKLLPTFIWTAVSI